MIFEDALKLLRDGKKITHPYLKEDEYFMACYMGFVFTDEDIEEIKKRGISIVKMKGNKEHAEMRPPKIDWLETELHPFNMPSIPIFALIQDDWEEYIK